MLRKHNKVLENLSFVKQKLICIQIRWFTPGILFVDMNISRQIQTGHNLKEIQELIIQRHKLRYYDSKFLKQAKKWYEIILLRRR